jgi:hypothetical protein
VHLNPLCLLSTARAVAWDEQPGASPAKGLVATSSEVPLAIPAEAHLSVPAAHQLLQAAGVGRHSKQASQPQPLFFGTSAGSPLA